MVWNYIIAAVCLGVILFDVIPTNIDGFIATYVMFKSMGMM